MSMLVSLQRPYCRRLFIATTWAGLVGFYTGMKYRPPNTESTGPGHSEVAGFSISLNFRTVAFDGRHLIASTEPEDSDTVTVPQTKCQVRQKFRSSTYRFENAHSSCDADSYNVVPPMYGHG